MADDTILVTVYHDRRLRKEILERLEKSPFQRGPKITQNDEVLHIVSILVTKAEDVETIENWPEVSIVGWRAGYARRDVQACK